MKVKVGLIGVFDMLKFKNLRRNRAEMIASVIQEYRHKAYTLSSSEIINEVLEANDPDITAASLNRIYEDMYVTMAGDTYKAAASIVSVTGDVRISTHNFPSVYDLRMHSNEWDSSNIITIASRRSGSDRASVISIEDHRIEGGRQVLISILRRTFSESGRLTGYVIIDIMSDTIIPEVNESSLFTDVVLIDTGTFSAVSLIHPQRYGDFSEFPFLTDGSRDIYRTAIEGTDLELAAASLTPLLRENFRTWTLILAVSLIIGIAISIILSFIFSRSISKRMKRIVESMRSFQKGDFGIKLEKTGIREFDELSVTFNIMVRRIEILLERTREEEAKSAEAERKALESQMNPHFLFNSLTQIGMAVLVKEPAQVLDMVECTGRILRYSLYNKEHLVSLSDELAIVETYIRLYKMSHTEEVEFSISYTSDIPKEELDSRLIVPMCIQPVVENSLKHGFGRDRSSISIRIFIGISDGCLLVTIKDTGVGIENTEKALESNKKGIGLNNIRRRLELQYGDHNLIKVSSIVGQCTIVALRFPEEVRDESPDR